MVQLITEKEWLGLLLNEAIDKATLIGYTYRIVEEDGKSHMLEYNVRSNRVNFRLKNNKIIGIFTG